ncbi:Alpha/beta hydrolase-1 [Corchorus capsularis]|uniref:Alpha/beta hydrolase-1 n=1 Tax=Corchorus capsularis TaxID=210143 RepID=A0A1R3IEQ4_COCAP|nr:Alpha/beta hydrolase-1 [Corchorus capsularis]
MATGCISLTLPLPKVEVPLPLFTSTRTKIPTSTLPSISNLSRFRPNGFVVCSISSDRSTLGNQIQDKSNPLPQVQSCTWNWRGYSIRYQCSGSDGPALVLVHGFGANSDHWRKNIPVLAKSHRVYAIDLIGYGYSDKPNPRDVGDSFYTFETWASQLNDFCRNVIKDEAFFICNSIGGVVGLQAAVTEPQICKGILLLNISLRMLHITKQPWFGRPFIASFQNLLRSTAVGKLFFKSVATPESVRSILCQCYHDTSQVTDELVQIILDPGLQPGAVDVFLEFICYSGGPLPEELLPQVKCPVLIGWGNKDPWEIIELGRAYGNFDTVEDFVVLPNVGHCPQDEAPHLVNPLVESFVARHAKSPATSSTTI